LVIGEGRGGRERGGGRKRGVWEGGGKVRRGEAGAGGRRGGVWEWAGDLGLSSRLCLSACCSMSLLNYDAKEGA